MRKEKQKGKIYKLRPKIYVGRERRQEGRKEKEGRKEGK